MKTKTGILPLIVLVMFFAGTASVVRSQSGQMQIRGPVTNVKFAIYDKGIYPREIYVRQGKVAITIEDYSAGTSGVDIDRINEKNRSNAGKVERSARSWRGKNILVLEPGQYEVYSAGNPYARALMHVKAGN